MTGFLAGFVGNAAQGHNLRTQYQDRNRRIKREKRSDQMFEEDRERRHSSEDESLSNARDDRTRRVKRENRNDDWAVEDRERRHTSEDESSSNARDDRTRRVKRENRNDDWAVEDRDYTLHERNKQSRRDNRQDYWSIEDREHALDERDRKSRRDDRIDDQYMKDNEHKNRVNDQAWNDQQQLRDAGSAMAADELSNPKTAGDVVGPPPEFDGLTGENTESAPGVDRRLHKDAVRTAPRLPGNTDTPLLDQEDARPARTLPKAAGSKMTDTQVSQLSDSVESALDASPVSREVAMVAEDAEAAKPQRSRTSPKPTPEQIDRGATEFVQHYKTTGVDKMYSTLMGQGRVQEAQEFRTWVDTKETQTGMKHWAKAAAAATVGDLDMFVDSLSDAYNTKGYFSDGYDIDRAKTSIVKDDQGRPMGINVTFVDEETGETNEQLFDLAQMVTTGIGMMSPERVFENMQAQVNAAQGARSAAAKERRGMKDYVAKKKIDQQFADMGVTQDDIVDTALEIQSNHNKTALDPADAMSMEDALAQAMAAYGQSGGGSQPPEAGAPTPPVMRRPVQHY